MRINTATGPVSVNDLGKTLMHEHLVIGFPGWDSDTAAPSMAFREMAAICTDKVAELKSAGFSTLLDPCPNDLGRDVAGRPAEPLGERQRDVGLVVRELGRADQRVRVSVVRAVRGCEGVPHPCAEDLLGI